ncbi:hypothetical protein V6N13_108752 [Hibiscus sabdariffa]|uniref:Uncharacterized protein n=2 Tax=Hibiscus sabdariffa TaxID=183260 RepID=A0ABR2EGE3_9ROSI
MVVEDRRRRPRKIDNAGKPMLKETIGSRFDILHNFLVEAETISVGDSVGGINKQHNSPIALKSPVVCANGIQGIRSPQKQREDKRSNGSSGERILGASVIPMIPGRVPIVSSHGITGSTD